MFLLVVFLGGMVFADVPRPLNDYAYYMNVQGRVTDTSGDIEVPVTDGHYNIVFTLQRSLIGSLASWADAGWSESVRTYIRDGVFNVILGTGVAMPIFDPRYDYRVMINFDSHDMTPAQDIVAVPLATTARNVRGGNVKASIPAAETNMLASAVEGINYRADGAANALALNPGVAGSSTAGYSIYGLKIDDADNDQKAAIFGMNLETNGAADILVLNPGVLGQSSAGYGVIGWASNAVKAGVFGLNANASLVPQGPGVYALGTIGVVAKGATGVDAQGTSVGVYARGTDIGLDVGGLTAVEARTTMSGATDRWAKLAGSDRGGTYYNEDGTAVSASDAEKRFAVMGRYSSSIYGALGYSLSGSVIPSNAYGVFGYSSVVNPAIYGLNTRSDRNASAVKGYASTRGRGVTGHSWEGIGVYGISHKAADVLNWRDGVGVLGVSNHNPGVYGESVDAPAVYGKNISASSTGLANKHGVSGVSTYGNGVNGYSERSYGIVGHSRDLVGVLGEGAHNHAGVVGWVIGESYSPGNDLGGDFGVYSIGNLGVRGDVLITGDFRGGSVSPFGGLDIAEWVKTSDSSIQEGDVVVLDTNNTKSVVKSQGAYNTLVAGIISTKPAFCAADVEKDDDMDYPSKEEMQAKGYRMLALAGQVPCNVSAENGPISVGDLLTTANTPGYAMKATDPKIGTILGKAMEPLASGKGKITVLVTLQ